MVEKVSGGNLTPMQAIEEAGMGEEFVRFMETSFISRTVSPAQQAEVLATVENALRQFAIGDFKLAGMLNNLRQRNMIRPTATAKLLNDAIVSKAYHVVQTSGIPQGSLEGEDEEPMEEEAEGGFPFDRDEQMGTEEEDANGLENDNLGEEEDSEPFPDDSDEGEDEGVPQVPQQRGRKAAPERDAPRRPVPPPPALRGTRPAAPAAARQTAQPAPPRRPAPPPVVLRKQVPAQAEEVNEPAPAATARPPVSRPVRVAPPASQPTVRPAVTNPLAAKPRQSTDKAAAVKAEAVDLATQIMELAAIMLGRPVSMQAICDHMDVTEAQVEAMLSVLKSPTVAKQFRVLSSDDGIWLMLMRI